MNTDESAVRELLLSAEQQPALLSTREVLAQGRRRLRRRQLGPVVGVMLVAAVAAGGSSPSCATPTRVTSSR